MRLPSAVAAALVVSACSGGDPGLYLRFEPLQPDQSAFVGDYRPFVFQDRVFVTSETDTSEILADQRRHLDGYGWAAAAGDAIYALKQDGTVWKSTDGQAFTQASAEKFTTLGALGTRLLGLRRTEFGTADLYVSDDGAATWAKYAPPVDAGYRVGTHDSFRISQEAGGAVRLVAQVMDDSFGNANYASRTYELRGQVLTLVGIQRGTDPLFPPPFPLVVSQDGVAVFQNVDPGGKPDADATSLTVLANPGPQPDLAQGKRLRWASPLLNDWAVEMVPLGLDSQGRLLVSTLGRVLRSVKPLTAGADDRADVLRGPGCDQRNTFELSPGSDDEGKITVKNASSKKVLVRTINFLRRWSKVGELDTGAENSLTIEHGDGVMVSDPADDTCLLFHRVGGDASLTVN